MKKTKAVLAILMAGTMMLGLAGCGGNSSSATQGTTTGTETGSAAGDAAGTDAAASALYRRSDADGCRRTGSSGNRRKL